MEKSGGQIAAKLAKPNDGGEDRLSALPNEVLVLILECLDTTAEVVRTSVLSRRWCGLWPLLSKLKFQLRPDGDRIRELLDVTDTPELHYISVTNRGAIADSATAWLPTAARRLAGGLVYRNLAPDPENNDEETTIRGGTIQLPCFENASTIELNLSFLGGLALPSQGVFTRLTDLDLWYVEFRGPCELGDLVSSPRCPCLQKLSISYSRGLGDDLSIHSKSLLQINLMYCKLRRRLTIETPLLQQLSVLGSFPPTIAADGEQGANITAPQIVSLLWMDQYDPRYFHLGQPRKLQTRYFLVYGEQTHRKQNHSCLKLLQQFKVLDSLHLGLFYFKHKQDICYYQYLLGDMTVLPQITFLHLDLFNYGHSFGASLFHVLRMCIGLRRLTLVLASQHLSNFVEPSPCPSGCVCDQPINWKTDELVLDQLEDVSIVGLRGAEHEVVPVQQFLGWATVLKKMRITLVNDMTEAKIAELREALAGSLRPETCVQFDTSNSK